eukprot:143884-Rhodomonas_salina.3
MTPETLEEDVTVMAGGGDDVTFDEDDDPSGCEDEDQGSSRRMTRRARLGAQESTWRTSSMGEACTLGPTGTILPNPPSTCDHVVQVDQQSRCRRMLPERSNQLRASTSPVLCVPGAPMPVFAFGFAAHIANARPGY